MRVSLLFPFVFQTSGGFSLSVARHCFIVQISEGHSENRFIQVFSDFQFVFNYRETPGVLVFVMKLLGLYGAFMTDYIFIYVL